jgi:hypothetical protein
LRHNENIFIGGHPHMRRILSLGLALGLATVLAGCATDRRNQTLTTTLNAYASTVRWGDFASAEQFVDPAMREAHPLTPLELARYQQLKVSEYDDGQGPVSTAENEVRQVVHIGLVNINTQAERSVIDRQSWHYDAQKNRWWLTSGLPDVSGP